MKFKVSKGYNGNIILQEECVNIVIEELSCEEIRVFLQLCIWCSNKVDKEIDELRENVGLENNEQLYNILETLDKKKLIKISASGISLLSLSGNESVVKRFKTNLNNSVEMMNENDISILIRTAEKCFGKMLSVAEINSITNLNSWYGLNNEVILILIQYVSSVGKKSISYIEKVALEWSEMEIDTTKKAHEYVRKSEERRTAYGKIKTLLKIYNRDLTKKEKTFVDKWADKFSDEQLKEAYEKTIDSTGKISFAYMDKILNSDGTALIRKTSAKKKTNKFTNFEQRKDDYSSIEDKMLQKMITEAGKKE